MVFHEIDRGVTIWDVLMDAYINRDLEVEPELTPQTGEGRCSDFVNIYRLRIDQALDRRSINPDEESENCILIKDIFPEHLELVITYGKTMRRVKRRVVGIDLKRKEFLVSYKTDRDSIPTTTYVNKNEKTVWEIQLTEEEFFRRIDSAK
jgi:hypothetical protein